MRPRGSLPHVKCWVLLLPVTERHPSSPARRLPFLFTQTRARGSSCAPATTRSPSRASSRAHPDAASRLNGSPNANRSRSENGVRKRGSLSLAVAAAWRPAEAHSRLGGARPPLTAGRAVAAAGAPAKAPSKRAGGCCRAMPVYHSATRGFPG
eukprot:355983-Chlamydomonas_euryale.AAC.3